MADSADNPHALFERRGRVGIITLNRPERLNAWSPEMAVLVPHLIEQCNDDDGIGAIVLTGSGRGFCAGADLSGQPRPAESGAVPPRRTGERLPFLLQRSKPLIAAVNGAAVGVGLTLTLCCDMRIASDQARFSMRFVAIGLTPELGSTYLLPQIVGLGYANELAMTGRIIDAAEADRVSLVNRVVPHASLLDEALSLANEIAFNPTRQVAWVKQLLYANAANDNLRSVVLSEDEISGQAGRTDAFAEAGAAFREKRPPNFHRR